MPKNKPTLEMSNQWMNKRAMIRDLAEMTGRLDSSEDLTSIHDRPPLKIPEIDEESETYLRICGVDRQGRGEGDVYSGMEPDLSSISQLLHMLQKEDVLPDRSNTDQLLTNTSQSLVVTKLNPLAPAYTPKNALESNHTKEDGTKSNEAEKDEAKNNEAKSDELKNNEAEKDEAKNNEARNDEAKTTEFDNKMTTDDIESEANRDKAIHDEIENKQLMRKSKKNVAITSLLEKLPENIEPKAGKAIKLLTPKDFLLNSQSNTENLVKEEKENNQASNCENSTLDVNPKEVEESIKKVTNWLDKPKVKKTLSPTPVTSRINFETVGFRRKHAPSSTTTADSVKSQTSDGNTTNSSSPRNSYKHYTPSENAKKVYEKLLEKSLAKKASTIVHESIWDKAERLMREKDEKIRKALLEKEKMRATPTNTDCQTDNKFF